jgi:hypothetical protein
MPSNFTTSTVFSSYLADAIVTHANSYNLAASGNVFNLALYQDSPIYSTFRFDTLAHNTWHGAGGQWVTGNEIPTAGSYTQGGYALTAADNGVITGASTNSWVAWTAGTVGTPATSVSEAAQTLTTAFVGCLIYDSTVSNIGICAVAFGGSYTVGGGTLAINWGNSPATTATPCIFYIST